MSPILAPRAAAESIAKRSRWEVADIFREYGPAYRQAHPLSLAQLKVMHAIEICRTAYLGGHLEQCDSCDYKAPSTTPAAIGIAPDARPR